MNQQEFFYKFGDKPKTRWHKIKWFLFKHFFKDQIEVFTHSANMPGFADGYKQGFTHAKMSYNAPQNRLASVLTEDFKLNPGVYKKPNNPKVNELKLWGQSEGEKTGIEIEKKDRLIM